MKRPFGARQLANVAYGGACMWKSIGVGKSVDLGKSLSELFAAIAKEAEPRLDQFFVQNLASMSWAFATMGQQDEQLFKALAKMTERRLDHFNAQDLANTAWALMETAGGVLRVVEAKLKVECLRGLGQSRKLLARMSSLC